VNRALFIGGNGIISSAVSRLALERGFELTLLNRGTDPTRPPIDGARSLLGDSNDPASIRDAIGNEEFDVVVNFRSFLPEQAASDVEIFSGRTGQYIYISSASAYEKPVVDVPILESTPLRNPYWQYSRDKIASEEVLLEARNASGFPATIVRPSHTYDAAAIPLEGGWTIIDRMRRGEEVVVHGDGTSLWVLTHNTQFALGFVPLLANPKTIGEAYTITSDEVLSWNHIYELLANAAGTTPRLVHIATETIARHIPEWGPGLLGDKQYSVIFDNSKIKAIAPDFAMTVPFAQGAEEIIAWHDASEHHRQVNPELNSRLDALIAANR
jgi:nucleoside-diphosphate-sugar epimerase